MGCSIPIDIRFTGDVKLVVGNADIEAGDDITNRAFRPRVRRLRRKTVLLGCRANDSDQTFSVLSATGYAG